MSCANMVLSNEDWQSKDYNIPIYIWVKILKCVDTFKWNISKLSLSIIDVVCWIVGCIHDPLLNYHIDILLTFVRPMKLELQ